MMISVIGRSSRQSCDWSYLTMRSSAAGRAYYCCDVEHGSNQPESRDAPHGAPADQNPVCRHSVPLGPSESIELRGGKCEEIGNVRRVLMAYRRFASWLAKRIADGARH